MQSQVKSAELAIRRLLRGLVVFSRTILCRLTAMMKSVSRITTCDSKGLGGCTPGTTRATLARITLSDYLCQNELIGTHCAGDKV